MRKLIAALAAVVLALTAAGCAAKEESIASPEENGRHAIAFVGQTMGISWFDRMKTGVENFASKTGNDAYLLAPASMDADAQDKLLKQVIEKHPQAICVFPISAAAVEETLKKARAEGIYVICCGASGSDAFDYDIEPYDNYACGAAMMDALAKKMGGVGKYATSVSSLTNTGENEREEGAVKRQEEAYPGMSAVERKLETGDSRKSAAQVMSELIKAYPDLKGFLGFALNDAPGAADALTAGDLAGSVAVAGTALPSSVASQLDSGAVTAAFIWDPAAMCEAMGSVAALVIEKSAEKLTDGLDLGVEGYESCTLKDEKYIYGSAWKQITSSAQADECPV